MAQGNCSARTKEKRNVATTNIPSVEWIAVVVMVIVFETTLAAKFKTAPRLDKNGIRSAEYNAKQLWTGTYAQYWWNSFAKGTIPEMKWYRKIILGSEPRYDAMALLLIVKPVGTPVSFTDIAMCTAFYIAPDTLMTVAHCLTEKGVSKDSGHIIIARQNYVAQRDKDYTKELADKYERIVVEWVYEGAFCNSIPVWSCEEALDYAFLKIDGTSYNNAHYTLATPKAEGANKYDYIGTHASVVIAGLPGEWSKFNEPAEVEGVLHYATDDAFKEQPAIAKLIEILEKQGTKMDLEKLKNNEVAAVSLGKGTMAVGASGGPWLIAEKDLTKEQKTARLKWVVGMTLWGTAIPTEKQMPNKPFAERQKFATVSLSKLFTKEFVAMAKEIAAIKDGAKTMQSVMKDHIK